MSDLNRKTLRHFYCRDALWHTFERMSEDFDRGIDDLVNEAMHLFAREKGYLPADNDRAGGNRPPSVARPPVPPQPSTPGPLGRPPSRMGLPPPPPMPSGFAAAAGAVTAQGDALAPPLYVVFQNQRFLVDKEQFIIGRGAKSSDLPIRDGNISRKHAAVIRKNGGYYIKDLGSTNGIDYNGARIDNKRIEEGDVFTICDYEIRFTYR
jgi:hypothetical protein